MIYLPSEIKQKMKQAMQSPVGTFQSKVTLLNDIFAKEASDCVLLDHTAGGHYFRIEKRASLIHFYHFSAGTGTRQTTVNVENSVASLRIMMTITWSTEEIKLYLGPLDVEGGKLLNSVASEPDKHFRLTNTGNVIEINKEGVEYFGLTITEDGVNTLDSTAIESWNETLRAVDVMLESTQGNNYMFDVAKSNFAAVACVTGIETYCKRRLQELQLEGIKLDFEALDNAGISNKSLRDEIFKETTNYFQNLCYMKKIWRYLVQINVVDINENSWRYFSEVLFPHRHTVVHVHALKSDISLPNKNKPIFIATEINNIRSISDEFIQALHAKTLDLC